MLRLLAAGAKRPDFSSIFIRAAIGQINYSAHLRSSLGFFCPLQHAVAGAEKGTRALLAWQQTPPTA